MKQTLADPQGYIKSWRRIMDNNFLMYDNTAYVLFTKLLHLANRRTGTFVTGRYQLSERTNIKPTTVYKALLRLEAQGMVTLSSDRHKTTITICKWKQYQGDGDSKSDILVTSKGHLSDNSVTLNKKEELRIKNISTNVDTETFGNSEINDLFAYWEEMTGNKITANTTKNRYACKNLLKKHGADNLKRMIGGVAYSHGEKYAPSIANFIQLQAKWDDLVVWGKKHKTIKKGGTYKI